jgi:hypothetical protein
VVIARELLEGGMTLHKRPLVLQRVISP